ncbi:unnamed protein product [Strongylus vulgaris]|uniref:Uncharacterized protein n=1 Tax=Strongylus vulgaris TaxID=40348 RepID=A0A3P7KX72_STRVU|nr:unnamed protein product [Strongylus vulgaris]
MRHANDFYTGETVMFSEFQVFRLSRISLQVTLVEEGVFSGRFRHKGLQ